MKYEQGYVDRAQGKPPRYPLEAEIARGDRGESGSLVSDVPPSPTVLGSTTETSRDPPAGTVTKAPSAELSSEAVEEPRQDITSV